ncbi:helix-turn-helix domain-containing protein [Singulisphaera sp. GP187]|uniref:helix-turn-helix domain-containing protein n=1 Tax=Singulisphaera sp. GP187 TaxID=1882752 RepID=UPI0013564C0B|nr:helix-turn-helix domain-containing protein [Singulisphaera sp. GP187]
MLKADADGPAWDDAKISETVGCRTRTVENIRQAFVLEGFEEALARKQRATPPTPKLLDGVAEAKLIAMRLGKPPAGFGHWTLRLLADQLVELEIAASISPETVRQTLKKWDDQAENRILGDPSRCERRVRRQHRGGAGDVRKSL